MTAICPTCGQPVPVHPDAALLLRLLSVPVRRRQEKRSKKLPPQDHRREVYVAGHSPYEWYLSFGGEIEYSGPFSRDVVMAIMDRLEPTYPGTDFQSFRLREGGR